MFVCRNPEPRYIVRDRVNLILAVQLVEEDRTTPAVLTTADRADLRVYLRGELVVSENDLVKNAASDGFNHLLTGTEFTDKGFGPTLEHWTVKIEDVGSGLLNDHDILKDGWLVRYFPTPTLTDADILDLNPDLLAIAGPSVLTETSPGGPVAGFERFHKRAWSLILRKLFRMGRRAELVLSPSQLWDVEYHTTMSLIARYYWTTMGDQKWRDEAKDHAQMARDAWGDILLQYDLDEDGRPDERWTYPATPLIRTGRTSTHGGWPLASRTGGGTIP